MARTPKRTRHASRRPTSRSSQRRAPEAPTPPRAAARHAAAPSARRSTVRKPSTLFQRKPTFQRKATRRSPIASKTLQVLAAAPVARGESEIPVRTPPQHTPPPSPLPAPVDVSFPIPTGYGDNRMVLMVKDPWWLYAYWEIRPDVERQARRQLSPEETGGLRSVLRVYDVTARRFPEEPAHHSFDVTLSGLATNWYLHTNAPNRSFIVDLGLLTRAGRFITLARSNRVTTPRFGPSEILDEAWMVSDEDYWKLFGLTAGIGMGASPSGLKALLERHLASPGLFSPGLFSPVKVPKDRSFWLRVDTELILQGATDPKASVSIQGRPITLNADGTFSVRMSLPDGTQTIPVQAASPDRQDTKTITPIVTRKTEGHTKTRDQKPETRDPDQTLKSPVSGLQSKSHS